MRPRVAAAAISVFCFIASVYLAGLSLQVANDASKRELVALAVSFFIAGIVVLIATATTLMIRGVFFKDQ